MAIFVVDVSHHDWNGRVDHGLPGQVDWPRVRATGIEVMCARATYGDPQGSGAHGTRFETRHFADFIAGARAAGFGLCGGYHNLVHGDQSSINRQVDWLRRELDTNGANWAMLDVERYEELIAAGTVPTLTDALRFAERFAAVDGRVLAIYLPHWIWRDHLDPARPDLRQLRGPLIASDYGEDAALPMGQLYAGRDGDHGPGWAAYGGKTPALWQFGSRSIIPGISDYPHRKHDAHGRDIDRGADINAFRGTLAELRTLLSVPGEDDDVPTPLRSDDDFKALILRVDAFLRGEPVIPNDPSGHPYTLAGTAADLAAVKAAQTSILANLQKLSGQDFVNEDEIVKGVLGGLATQHVDALAAMLISTLPADVRAVLAAKLAAA